MWKLTLVGGIGLACQPARPQKFHGTDQSEAYLLSPASSRIGSPPRPSLRIFSQKQEVRIQRRERRTCDSYVVDSMETVLSAESSWIKTWVSTLALALIIWVTLNKITLFLRLSFFIHKKKKKVTILLYYCAKRELYCSNRTSYEFNDVRHI